MVQVAGDQFLADRPLDATADAVYLLVEVVAAPAQPGHLLLDLLQFLRAELAGRGAAEQVFHHSQRVPDHLEVGVLPPLPLVVAFRELVVGEHDIVDGGVQPVFRERPPAGQPARDESLILGLDGRGREALGLWPVASLTEVVVLAVKADDRPAVASA
jgi:hypothetical protein